MKKLLLTLALITCIVKVKAQNSCNNPYSLCDNTLFNGTTGIPSFTLNALNNSCLGAQPNPTWFYFKPIISGQITYNIQSLENNDVDFACWGPFQTIDSICNSIDTSNIISCSYSVNSFETLIIDSAIANNYYILLVTNYSNSQSTLLVQNAITSTVTCTLRDGISGFVFNDTNNDCELDPLDNYLKNIPIRMIDTIGNIVGISNTNKINSLNFPYYFSPILGSYIFSIDTINKTYTSQCNFPNTDTLINIANTNIIDSVNFTLKCKTGFDIGVQSVVTTGWVFPGQTHHLKINAGDMAKWYGLNCASGVAGQMLVNVTGAVHYSTSAVGAIVPVVSGNTFTYNIANFGTINNDTDFDLVFQTDTTANVGDSICVSISMTPTLGDINVSNNSYHYCYQVVNSHDPNKKEVYPVDVLPNYHDWFTYTVHFQNTGSAPAMNIRLKDTLDTNLDIKTFEVINYSHANTWQIYNNGLVFNFQNIMLPDSTSNPEGSKGFVQYRIKPKTGMVNDSQIKNTAYIYFDFNAPIITNTTINHFMLPASLTESFINKLVSIYPNPTTGDFSIQLNSNEKHTLEVFDLTGKLIHQQIIENGNAFIDGNMLSNGIYSIKVSNNSGSVSKKLVVLK